MVVRYTQVDASYWALNEGFLTQGELFNQSVSAWVLNPDAIDVLGGTKLSTLSTESVNGFKQVFNPAISIGPNTSFTAANWTSNGWTAETFNTMLQELGVFITNNIGNNSAINVDDDDMNLVLVVGQISGTEYIIPIVYVGNQGTAIAGGVDTIYGDMLFTDLTYEFLYGDALFTDVTFDTTIDGGDFNG